MNDLKTCGYVNHKKVIQSEKGNFVSFTLAKSVYDYKLQKNRYIYLSCVIFGKRAEYFQSHINDNDMIMIDGELDEKEYTTKEGIAKKQIAVNVSDIMLLRKGEAKTENPFSENQANMVRNTFQPDNNFNPNPWKQ